jgi:hypothetical protein
MKAGSAYVHEVGLESRGTRIWMEVVWRRALLVCRLADARALCLRLSHRFARPYAMQGWMNGSGAWRVREKRALESFKHFF